MSDNKNLLGDLKIDRSAAPPPRSGRGGLWLIVVVVVGLIALAAVAWMFKDGTAMQTVKVHTVQRASASTAGPSVLDASGYVVARRQATVSSKLTGKVTEVLIEEGMAVDEGQVLARIDAATPLAQLALSQSQLASAQAGLAEVQAQLDEAGRQYQRNQELARQKLVSESVLDASGAQLDTLKARLEVARRQVTVAQRNVDLAQQQVDDTVIRAPFTGVVTVKAAQPGEMISPISAGGGFTRTGIGTVVDMDSLEVEVDVNESFINRVQAGQPVSARLNAYPDWTIPAEVIAIVPTADRQKATVRVRIGFREKDARILPEMGVRVSFLDEAAPASSRDEPAQLQIPAAAVQRDGEQTVVYLIEDGTAQRRAVTLGRERSGRVEVLGGLRGGERIVAEAGPDLHDGAPVQTP